eukprot:9503978-Pyramimonas_sp.AAC.3
MGRNGQYVTNLRQSTQMQTTGSLPPIRPARPPTRPSSHCQKTRRPLFPRQTTRLRTRMRSIRQSEAQGPPMDHHLHPTIVCHYSGHGSPTRARATTMSGLIKCTTTTLTSGERRGQTQATHSHKQSGKQTAISSNNAGCFDDVNYNVIQLPLRAIPTRTAAAADDAPRASEQAVATTSGSVLCS